MIATGTRAGAVDADFSNETQLELWDLDLGKVGEGEELKPVGSVTVDSRYVFPGVAMADCRRVASNPTLTIAQVL